MGSPSEVNTLTNTESVHNHNCFAYLIQLKTHIIPSFIEIAPELKRVYQLADEYDPQCSYGNLYSDLISFLDEQIDEIYPTLYSDEIHALDNLIFGIYHNDNHIIEDTAWLINAVNKEATPKTNISKKIEELLENNGSSINRTNPQKAEGVVNRLDNLLSSNFKPQHDTNIPSLKHYSYKLAFEPIEYRFSTQAQRHNGDARISPLFKHWLRITAKRSSASTEINHIYFNNLGLDRSPIDIAGAKEKDLTLELHTLEQNPSLKVAMITLPAAKGLMSSSAYKKIDDRHGYRKVFDELLETALTEEHEDGVADLYISEHINNKLFNNHRKEILRDLLTKSFRKLGFHSETASLTSAQKQAVWFHFIKYELTHFILLTLKPNSYNFSCKDAIDRGAVSSAYYNLIKSFELNIPITKEEFEQAIDSAASNVKGRGMNFHRRIIWNALDVFINANYEEIIKDNKKSWLIFWRDMNCPHSRAAQVLDIRMNQFEHQLTSLPKDQDKLKKAGRDILNSLKMQIDQKVSGQRLLLEIVSRTSELLSNPSLSSIKTYNKRANEFRINHGFLYVIGGLMKFFLGLLLYLPSLGFSEPIITSGLATIQTGFFASDRNKLSNEMMQLSENPTLCPVA